MEILAGAEPFAADRGPVGVLLCHGFTGTPQSMRRYAEYLSEAGYTVRLPLLPGHGTDWRTLNATAYSEWVEADLAAFDQLRARCTATFIAGLSMGGALALRIAELRPDQVRGLILVNPAIDTRSRLQKAAGLLRHVVPYRRSIAGDIAMPGVEEVGYDRFPLRAVDQLNRLQAVVREDLPQVTAPILMFRSLADHTVDLSSTIRLTEAFGPRQLTIVPLTRSYHVATLDYDADFVFARTAEFIADRMSGHNGGRIGPHLGRGDVEADRLSKEVS